MRSSLSRLRLAASSASIALAAVVFTAACEPPPAAPAPAAAPPALEVARAAPGAVLPAAASAQDWSQLVAFQADYTCPTSTSTCAASPALVVVGTAGPGSPLYSTGANIKAAGPTAANAQLIASATKMPAAAAILEVLNKHGYSPGTTVDTIVSAYASSCTVKTPVCGASGSTPACDAAAFLKSWQTMETAAGAQITMGQLLSMTSGLTTLKGHIPGQCTAPPPALCVPPPPDPLPACMNDLALSDPYSSISLACCAAQIAGTSKVVVFPPGTAYGYSYAGYQVAGYVATLAAGGTYAGDWLSLFKDTIVTPLGLGTYSYDNDLKKSPKGPGTGGATVTNPRIAGGASSDAYDYGTILTMILNDGVINPGQSNSKTVLTTQAINWLETNQLPTTWLATSNPDDGLSPNRVYDTPLGPTPSWAAPFFQGYSFGLFIPTARGVNNGGFFVTLQQPTPPDGPALFPADLTTPHDASKVFLDPGLYGATGWFDTDSTSTYGAFNLIFQYPGDGNMVGLDMMRTANSAIACQFQYPGVSEPFKAPINNSYCVAQAAGCMAGAIQACPCPAPPGCSCIAQQTCGGGGVWGPCKPVGNLNGPCPPVQPGNPQ
jgi:CubicO group peptidase (beta-lactamase class C family)